MGEQYGLQIHSGWFILKMYERLGIDRGNFMGNAEMLEMTGSVEDVIFRNEKNGYAVVSLNNGEELVTAVGTMPFVGVGEELHVVGEWVSSQNYGTQFKVQAVERSRPQEAPAILKYLSSGAVKGIGPAIARKIVDAFGDDTLRVLEGEPERLCQIRGITREKAEKLSGEFRRVGGIRETMMKLGSYGITPQEAVRAWKVFGDRTAGRVRDDPYCLCGDGIQVDFARADRIAAAMELPADHDCRLRAGIVHVLKHNEGNGHTCLPADKLLSASSRMLGVTQDAAASTLEELKADATLVSRRFRGREFIFTAGLYRTEVYVAGRIRMMLHYPAQSIVGVDHYISTIEEEQGIRYEEMQKNAIREALSKGMLILTGGPGTGKTTTLRAIIRILEFNGEKVFLGAPTGRAAKRMSDLTGREAKTIHRLLQVKWDENDRPVFDRNEKNLLECDALIVDELSMVDVSLFEATLRALATATSFPPSARATCSATSSLPAWCRWCSSGGCSGSR